MKHACVPPGGSPPLYRREEELSYDPSQVIHVPQPILVGYDARSGDRAAVNFGVAAARFTGAPLIIASARAGAAAFGAAGSAIVEEEYAGDEGMSIEHLGRELAAEGIKVECRTVQAASAATDLSRPCCSAASRAASRPRPTAR
jgi:hypothetical protein